MQIDNNTVNPLNFGPIFVFMEASNPNEIFKITIIVFEPLNS